MKNYNINYSYIDQKDGFLGIKEDYLDNLDDAKVTIIPFGMESSLVNTSGTRTGPRAIIKSSHQIELFDVDNMREYFRYIGIRTLNEQRIPFEIPYALSQIEEIVSKTISYGKFPFILGGERAITAGAIKPFLKKYPDIVILHFDAHIDLEENNENNINNYSSSTFRNILNKNISKIISYGIRNISKNEFEFYSKNKDKLYINWAKDINNWDINKVVNELSGKKIYLSFGVDVFDPSIMGSTGAPEPGGILWNDAIRIISAISEKSDIIGADIVELAPITYIHSCDFLAAKLVYKILECIFKEI